MRQIMVRYKVKPDQAAENERLVRAVYDELHQNKPEDFRYATFRLDDGVTFVHIAVEAGDGQTLPQVKAFQEFQKGISDRCDEPPVATPVREIGSFRLFGD